MDNKSITKEHESLYTITSIINLCLTCVEVLENEKAENKTLQNKLYLIVSSYLMIQLNNFLEEWNNHFNSNQKIIAFRKRMKPIISEVQSFDDIKKARNTIFAHNRDSRNGNTNPLLLDKDVFYNLPIAVHDLSFVILLLQILQKELQAEFKEEFNSLSEYKRASNKIKAVKSRFKNEKEVLTKVVEIEMLIKSE